MSNINTNPGEIGQKKPILAVVIAALIVVVLLAPCILAALSDTIYPRTTVAGIEVGGMEYAQAQDVLARELHVQEKQHILLVLQVHNMIYRHHTALCVYVNLRNPSLASTRFQNHI